MDNVIRSHLYNCISNAVLLGAYERTKVLRNIYDSIITQIKPFAKYLTPNTCYIEG